MGKKRSTRIWKWAVAAAVVVLVSGTGLVVWQERHNLLRSLERASLPSPVAYQVADSLKELPTSEPAATTDDSSLPVEVNLAVPFTPQAPHANWDPPYKEFCEEASVLMAMSYLRGQAIPNADVADQELLKIRAFEERRFGYYEDTTIEETAVIFRQYYGYDRIQLRENPSAQDIKRAVASGKVVVVPAAGQQLGNPYFQQPGPLYHMFVVKGYTANGKFIVNDPGTRRGADFLYDEAVVMNAMHDWRADGQVMHGRKVILVAG